MDIKNIFDAIKQNYHQSKQLTQYDGFLPVAFATKAPLEHLFARGEHHKIRVICRALIKQRQNFGYYFLAKSHFLCNELDAAYDSCKRFLTVHPTHIDTLYLQAEILIRQNSTKQAYQLLQHVLDLTARGKTWQMLALLCNSQARFERYHAQLTERFGHARALPFDIASHLTQAAYIANTDAALTTVYQLWHTKYQQAKQTATVAITPKKHKHKKKYHRTDATLALKALKDTLIKEQIEFFLISGTLLGCIREGQLLGHDKDIDVGIWRDIDVERVRRACQQSGLFYILPSSNTELLVVRHVNGITIDIFVHHQDTHNCWHFGGKCKWLNTPFSLVAHEFLDDYYLIPKEYSRYLAENYGDDWLIPKLDFDSALDTPNMHITNTKKMLIYLYKRLLNPNGHLSSTLRQRLHDAIERLEYHCRIAEK